ncbi:MAG: 3-hydroxyacyl-CoA dehydrogenase [Gammaproteobacteria bacterium]|nr:3-hydroxyacyl-CoA dehydrogenase [Gammaproteobacteria bacterium]
MTVEFRVCGDPLALSVPEAPPSGWEDAPDAVVYLGSDAWIEHRPDADREVVLIELGDALLGSVTGEKAGVEGDNRVGMARFTLGGEQRDLVELVTQPGTDPVAIAAARRVIEDIMGLRSAVCRDRPGRILNRLVRPYYNAALRALDEQLASAADLDKTVRLGLGYPEGPIELLERTGVADHLHVSRRLWEQIGEPAYFPARRAQVADMRRRAGGDKG